MSKSEDYLKSHTAYYKALEIGPNSDLEIDIALIAQYSHGYALNILKAPFPLGEPEYTKNILNFNHN